MNSNDKKMPRRVAPARSAHMVEAIFGCKWSLTVYQLLKNGTKRPGEMVRSVDGLTTKVLNDCLRRNLEFGILERKAFNEVPPRVEYAVTPMGEKFIQVLDALEALQDEINASSAEAAPR
jgi:DNA-binding HxlR family transcriptional regulator